MKGTYCFRTDEKLCLNSWGMKMAELTGKAPNEVLGKKYYEILPRIFSESTDALFETIEKKRGQTLKGYSFRCLNGGMKADVEISFLEGKNGKASGTEVSIFPVSSCSAVKELHDSKQLIDIGKIASTLAHGVRNPLNAIKGAVVFLRENYAEESILVEFTDLMESEIARLDNFISRFLSTSLSDVVPSEVEINSILRKIEVFTSLQVQASNIKALFAYGDVPPVSINAFHLEQAILNVINNAIEAMKSGGQLTVKSMSENREGVDFAVIEIADTGPGMSESGMEGLSHGSGNKGRGFGLFITREVLQYYGGHLEIRTSQGSGTTVRLYLPVGIKAEGDRNAG